MLWFERTACDVLEEMRKINEVRNYSSLAGLIEELQSMCNRMECHLAVNKKYTELLDEVKELDKKAKQLKKEVGDASTE